MATIPTLEELKRLDTSHDLILSLTPGEEIIQFNKESERFTGYLRDEVLHKKISEILIPTDSTKQWKDLFSSIQQDMWIDNFVLPLKTKENQIHMITWTGFLVKDEHGLVKDICIFGKPLKTEPREQRQELSSEPVLQQKEPVFQQKESETQPETKPEMQPEMQSETQSETQPETKPEMQPETAPEMPPKTQPATKPETQPEMQSETQSEIQINLTTTVPQTVPQAVPQHQKRETPMKHGVKKIIFAREKNSTQEYTHPIAPEKATPSVERETSTTPSEIIAKQRDATSQKLDLILQSLSDLSQKYETVVNRITELEMKDEPTEKNHIDLETPQQSHTEEHRPLIKNRPSINPDTEAEDQQQSEETEHTFFSDPFGLKRQHTELDLKKQRLELRMKELESFETRLMKEKDIFHARVEEFSRWQEKLIALESEIEKRRQELIKQENFVLKKNPQPTTNHTTNLVNQDSQKSTASEVPRCDDETLDKIPQSAAIIQRGILKQINTPFLELLGYSIEEIVEKSYFDFIALEGLADVEQYYLDRLKGESISVYRTVFSAKDNTKISAEVSIKQTIYNGEKAEIAIITCIGSNPI